MNTDFSHKLTELRKEKGLSQKQAAQELGLSQALLSHYEKGIRECGLDFVVRAADYYGVSADYMLGRSSVRNTASSENQAEAFSNVSVFSELNDSLNILCVILKKINSKNLTEKACSFLMRSVRMLLKGIVKTEDEAEIFRLQSEALSDYYGLCSDEDAAEKAAAAVMSLDEDSKGVLRPVMTGER